MGDRFGSVLLLAGLAVLLGVPLFLALPRTDGFLICASDDPYIHMAMAKNLAENGVWGVSAGEFSSSSSSPLWTLILAGWFAVFGVQDTAPILLNFGLAVALCFVCRRLFVRELPAASPWFVALATLVLLVLTPLSALVFIGQEHLLQTLLTLLVVVLAGRVLLEERGTGASSEARLLAIIAPFYTATRYEGAALVLIVCALLVLRKRWRYGVVLALLAFLPIGIYGAYSLAQGASFLPNSVLLRMEHTNVETESTLLDLLGGTAVKSLWRTKHLLALIACSALLFGLRYRRTGFWESRQLMAVVFVLTTMAHLQFGKTGWFFRYEAYLVALGVFQVTLVVHELLRAAEARRQRIHGVLVLLAVAALGAYALVPRAVRSFRLIHRGSTNIFEQQVQMGRFLHRYYAGSTVALNDIGAPTFLGGVRCLDLVGLANYEVAVRMRAGDYDTEEIERVTREQGATIAVLYESWFERFGGLPAGWVRAGTWRIWDNIVCGSDTVSFFAVEPSALAPLLEHLREFDQELPERVTRAGAYLEP